jgi:hypothetical protein
MENIVNVFVRCNVYTAAYLSEVSELCSINRHQITEGCKIIRDMFKECGIQMWNRCAPLHSFFKISYQDTHFMSRLVI